MMQLPHGCRRGVYGCCGVSDTAFFMRIKRHGAIFARLLGKSSMSFPAAAMVKPQMLEGKMIKKEIIAPDRIRRIQGGFSFIPHRFVTGGFLVALQQKELLLYLFLVAVCDRHGLSFYSYDSICSLLKMTVEQYIAARDGLIEKDLIAFDGTLFQVLDLPAMPRKPGQKASISTDQTQSIKDILKGIGHD